MNQPGQRSPWLWLCLSFLAAGISFQYTTRVLAPWENYLAAKNGKVNTAIGDLYSPWFGSRALLVHGKNPYSLAVSQEIQTTFYGHPMMQNDHSAALGTTDEQRFAYPVYVAFLLAPTVRLEFATLQTWAPIVFILLTAASVLLWLGVLGWRPPWTAVVAMTILILSSPQIVQGLRLRQLGLLVGFLIAVSAWCVARSHLVVAGAALALATIKPQMVALPLAWFLFWSLGDLKRRWRLGAGFGGSLALLTGAGEVFLPGWPRDFLFGLAAYTKYAPSPALLQVVLGKRLGGVAVGLIILALLALAWKGRKHRSESGEFVTVMAIFLIGATLAMPLVASYNQVLLILPALIILKDWAVLPKIGRFALLLSMTWPWVAEAPLLAVSQAPKTPGRQPLLPFILVLTVPFVMAGMMVVRWRLQPKTFSAAHL